MKQITTIIVFAFSLMFLTSSQNYGNIKGVRINMSVYGADVHDLEGNMPQSLVQIPTVSIESGILYFYDVFSTTVPVFVVDASDNVVFSATLYPGEDKKVLPTSLSGTYTLYMRVGTIMYYGNLII